MQLTTANTLRRAEEGARLRQELTPCLPVAISGGGRRAKLLILLERETGFEPATNSLEGCDSTPELLPLGVRAAPASVQQLQRPCPAVYAWLTLVLWGAFAAGPPLAPVRLWARVLVVR